MPKISSFAFCKETLIEENQPKAIDFLQILEASGGTLSFSILFSITDFSTSVDHSIHVNFYDPKDNILIETEKFILEGEEVKGDIDESRLVSGISLGVQFNSVQFEGQGLYKIELFFDDESLGVFHIPVVVNNEGGEE